MSTYHISLKPWKHCSINKELKKMFCSDRTGLSKHWHYPLFRNDVWLSSFCESESTLSLNANVLIHLDNLIICNVGNAIYLFLCA